MKHDEPLDALLRRTSRVVDGAARPGACLDAETLAAWADGTLTGTEREAAEAHTADCARCLAMVAAMANTAPPPAEAGRPTWSPIRWLLPLTTAAVAVTAWLVVRPADPPVPVSAPAQETAEMAKAPDALPPADMPPERNEARRQDAPASAKPSPTPAREHAAPPAAPAAVAEPPVAALKDEQVQLLARSAQLSGVIMSPDPKVRWRLSGRTVERSDDGGATWQAQQTGAAAALVAGAAPARDVVWIVGRAGTVLLSVDGATWQRLDFPDATADLVSVTATDALRATVTTSAGRTYTTIDGGRTWSLQEDSAGPF